MEPVDGTEQVNWLDDDEQQAWQTLVALLMRLPSALDTQTQRDADMTHFDYSVLAQLSLAPENRLQLAVLASQANASLSRLSHVVTKMEKAGWVEREAVPGSRASYAVLTDSGRARIAEAAPCHVAAVRALVFDGLRPAQVRQLHKLGSAMLTQLDKAIASGVGRA
ncbi:MarR family transcriptional regulator [Rhodococcus sp. HNM0569]|uniref:MarR family winged helix-turn-helix transcriptional regulator n=1 Tax=Rhodococcus sp. HNM0569 TaxID=2716340 RepID=UPI00146AEAD8|nr:MarR family transcriptional regulator [Rhodococcus sp. HNM0569]NLU82980.1 MarR family transcriptional regulator [Rhodococcus sp. HNM0569]